MQINLQKLPCKYWQVKMKLLLVLQAFDLGYQEVQLQAWGDDLTTLYSVALDIAAIDSRVSIKLPITADSITVAAQLKKQQALVTLTGNSKTCNVMISIAIMLASETGME